MARSQVRAKFVILPVDQGFEHGPARSFAPNPSAYDPEYHFELAIESGCNAYAAPLGFLEAAAGAHIVKVKPPKDSIEQPEAKKAFEKYAIATKTLSDRVRHVIQSAFNGKRIVIFSGGEAKDTNELLQEVRAIAAGGGSGSIIGRNSFQRPRAQALALLGGVIDIFRTA